METRLRPYRWLTAATILFAIGLLSSVDAEGQTADFVGDDDDNEETLSVPLEPTVSVASLSYHQDPAGVRSHHKQVALTPSDGVRRPASLTLVILPSPRECVSGIFVGLVSSRAPPTR